MEMWKYQTEFQRNFFAANQRYYNIKCFSVADWNLDKVLQLLCCWEDI
jgi:hypothetical protein